MLGGRWPGGGRGGRRGWKPAGNRASVQAQGRAGIQVAGRAGQGRVSEPLVFLELPLPARPDKCNARRGI